MNAAQRATKKQTNVIQGAIKKANVPIKKVRELMDLFESRLGICENLVRLAKEPAELARAQGLVYAYARALVDVQEVLGVSRNQ